MAVTTILVESDTKKLSLWKNYITTYDRETCKTTGDDLSGLGTPQEATDETLEQVLDILGKASGGVALIYAHANAHGLIMRVTTNANSAQSNILFGISRAWRAVFQMIALRSGKENKDGKLEFFIDLPKAKTLLTELKQFLDTLPGALGSKLSDPATLKGRADSDAWFDKWMDLMAEACLGGSNKQDDLRRVCRAMQKVRDLKYDRVEFRACNIGKDIANLNALKEFFGVKQVCAPRVTMFFGEAGVNPNAQKDINQGAKDVGGFRGAKFTPAVKSGHALNKITGGEAAMSSGRRNRIFESGGNVQVIMQVTETAPFEFSSRIFTVDASTLTTFLQAHYSPKAVFKAGSKRVAIGGVWCVSDPKAALPYLMPLEADYRNFLEISK